MLTLLVACGLSAGAARAQTFALSTNFARGATLNLGTSCGLSRHLSVEAAARYRPYSQSDNKERTFAVGAKWWPWHVFSGWWMSGNAQWQEFSETSDGGVSEGDRLGMSVALGYSRMLARHLNLDVGVSVWAGNERCLVYDCGVCGHLRGSSSGKFLSPDGFILALAYVF